MPSFTRLSLIALTVVSVSACANLKSLTDNMRMLVGKSVQFVEPAKTNELKSISAIAITDGNNNSSALMPAVQAQLMGIRIGESPYYKQVLLGAVPSGATNDLKWAELELAVLRLDVREESSVEQRFRCPGEGTIRKCKSEEAQHYNVSCRTRIATAGATLSAKDHASATLLASRNLVKHAESKVCSDNEGSTLETAANLQQNALSQLSASLLEGLTPTLIKRPLDLIDEDDALQGQDAALVELSYQMAAEGQIEPARNNYLLLLDRFPNNATLLFNAGYCEQALGNFANARQYYDKASQATNAPQSMLEKYRQETNAWLAKGYERVSL